MTCGHCVASVTEEIGELAGVEDVDVVLETGDGHRHQHRARSTAPTSRPPWTRPGTRWPEAAHDAPRPRASGRRDAAPVAGRRRPVDRRPATDAGHDGDTDVNLDITGHDLRLVREPDRAQAQQARRRARHASTTPPRRPWSRTRDTVSTDDLLATVAAAGYAATPLPATRTRPPPATARRTGTRSSWPPCAQRLVVCGRADACRSCCSAMVPALQFDHWQWVSLTLAAPVVRVGRPGRSTAPRGPTCGTAPPPWTRWSRSACWPRSAGRWSRCSSARPATRA